MRYEKKMEQDFVVITFSGDFSAGPGAEQMLAEMATDLRDDKRKFVLDFGSISYLNSSGIRVLLRAKQIVEGTGGMLALVNLHQSVKKILEDLHILDMFRHFPTRQEVGLHAA